MPADARERILDAAAHLVTEDGFDAMSLAHVATRAGLTGDAVLAEFGSLEDLFVAMLNREFARLWRGILDDIERDPRGGLLSHIYRYTLIGVYERPVVRALYLADRAGIHTIMRSSHGFPSVPRFGVSAEFIERMQEAGMVRPEVDPARLSAVLAAVAAGASITAPHADVDLINEGLFDLLASAVDTDAPDTTPGKSAFVEHALALFARDERR